MRINPKICRCSYGWRLATDYAARSLPDAQDAEIACLGFFMLASVERVN